MAKKTGRYSPARRLDQVRALLNSTGGATVYEIAERLEVSVRTAIRYLRALEDTGERLYEDTEGRKKIWRLMPSTREAYLRLTTSQMTSPSPLSTSCRATRRSGGTWLFRTRARLTLRFGRRCGSWPS